MNWNHVFEIALGVYIGIAIHDFLKAVAKLFNHVVYGAEYDPRIKD